MIELIIRIDVISENEDNDSDDNDFFLTQVSVDDNKGFTEALDLAINQIIDGTNFMVKKVYFPKNCDKWVFLDYFDHGQFPACVTKVEFPVFVMKVEL